MGFQRRDTGQVIRVLYFEHLLPKGRGHGGILELVLLQVLQTDAHLEHKGSAGAAAHLTLGQTFCVMMVNHSLGLAKIPHIVVVNQIWQAFVRRAMKCSCVRRVIVGSSPCSKQSTIKSSSQCQRCRNVRMLSSCCLKAASLESAMFLSILKRSEAFLTFPIKFL
jgi:hypothetical protein